MTIFQRHKRSTVLLIVYLMWWLFMACIFWVKSHSDIIEGPHCDFSPIIFFYSIPIAIGGSLILLCKHIDSKDGYNDNLLFAGIMLLPLIIAAGIYLFPTTDKKAKQVLQNNTAKLVLNSCDSPTNSAHPPVLYKKVNHKLGYWIQKKL